MASAHPSASFLQQQSRRGSQCRADNPVGWQDGTKRDSRPGCPTTTGEMPIVFRENIETRRIQLAKPMLLAPAPAHRIRNPLQDAAKPGNETPAPEFALQVAPVPRRLCRFAFHLATQCLFARQKYNDYSYIIPSRLFPEHYWRAACAPRAPSDILRGKMHEGAAWRAVHFPMGFRFPHASRLSIFRRPCGS